MSCYIVSLVFQFIIFIYMNQFLSRSKSFAGTQLFLERSLHSITLHLYMTFERPEDDFSIDFHAAVKHHNVVNSMEYSRGQKISQNV